VNVELCKNLILAGISVSVCDSSIVKLSDLGHNFFLREDDVGKKKSVACIERIQELNPFAQANVIDEPRVDGYTLISVERIGKKSDGEYYTKVMNIAKDCREKGISFFYSRADSDGGLSVSDLGPSFTFLPDRADDGGKRIENFPPFAAYAQLCPSVWKSIARKKQPMPTTIWFDRIDALYAASSQSISYLEFAKNIVQTHGLNLSDESISRHCKVAGTQLVLVTAVLGGMLGQECIKAISKKGEPTNNVFVFDSSTDAGIVYLRVGADPDANLTSIDKPPAKKPKLTIIDVDEPANTNGGTPPPQNDIVILDDD